MSSTKIFFQRRRIGDLHGYALSLLLLVTRRKNGWRDLDEAEVTRVINMLEGDKPPDLDGFNMSFFKKCWYIVKEDVLKTFEVFYRKGEFVKS